MSTRNSRSLADDLDNAGSIALALITFLLVIAFAVGTPTSRDLHRAAPIEVAIDDRG